MRRLPLLTVSMIGAGLLAAASARAADMVPPEPPAAYGPPPIVVERPPVAVEPPPVVIDSFTPAPCWRFGGHGWGYYPCVAAPPVYWHGYRYGYRGRPYWAHARHWHRSYW